MFKLMGIANTFYSPPSARLKYEQDTKRRMAIRVDSSIGDAYSWVMLVPGQPAYKTPSLGAFDSKSFCLVNPQTQICQSMGFTLCFWMKAIKVYLIIFVSYLF